MRIIRERENGLFMNQGRSRKRQVRTGNAFKMPCCMAFGGCQVAPLWLSFSTSIGGNERAVKEIQTQKKSAFFRDWRRRFLSQKPGERGLSPLVERQGS